MSNRVSHRDLWPIFRGALFEWSEDKVPRMAAALAFYTLFSLAPILIIALAVADVFYTREEALRGILQQAQFLIGDDGIAAIRLLIENAPPRERSLPATLVGLATMFFAATGAFAELQDSLDTIWEVQPKPGLGLGQMAKDRILSFAMVLVIAFLLLVSLVISASLTAVSNSLLPFMPQQAVLLQVLHFVISFAVITVLFALIFQVLPDAKVAWQDVWLGAAVTSLLFGVGKLLFGLYLGHSTIGSSYGAAGSLVVVILWTYYSTLILLFGAEITQVQSRLRGAKIVPTPVAMHVTEHDRIQQGAPHAKDLELSAEDNERELADAAAAVAVAEPAARKRKIRVRRPGLMMTAVGLAIGWFLGRRNGRL